MLRRESDRKTENQIFLLQCITKIDLWIDFDYLFLVLLTIGSWRDTYQFFECLCKIVLRRKSAGLGDLCDGVVGVTQQSFAVGDPQLQQVVDR